MQKATFRIVPHPHLQGVEEGGERGQRMPTCCFMYSGVKGKWWQSRRCGSQAQDSRARVQPHPTARCCVTSDKSLPWDVRDPGRASQKRPWSPCGSPTPTSQLHTCSSGKMGVTAVPKSLGGCEGEMR